MKVTTALVLLFLVLNLHLFVQPSMGDGFCDSKCQTRCSKASVQDRCLKYCGLCCAECKCVPSGTYGNKNECPCYRDKVTAKGKPKCP